MYITPASTKNPSLVLFLIDVSASIMAELSPDFRRIDAISHLIKKSAVKMIQRSTKGALVSPRYHVAMFAYSSHVFDLLDGIKPIDELARLGIPQLTPLDMTNTARAFSLVKETLATEIAKYADCPAPIILHITDGEFNNGDDPTPIIEDIRNMSVKDGNVLLANVYIGHPPKKDVFFNVTNADWVDADEKKWCNMASTFPDAYRAVYREFGFHVPVGAKMYLRGYNPEAFELLLPMSAATPVTSNP
ncbi:MAG: VWA domain-containing protein [Anaerolineae bacterium]|nr:VWA domain-containing protein [Anaerolineae bacterium]